MSSDTQSRVARARRLVERCGSDAAGLDDAELLARAEEIVAAATEYRAGSETVEVWDRHLTSEFDAHDADATMATMVDDPYLLHVPVMTGGSGGSEVRHFYATHFIPKLPADWQVQVISRTVGVDQVVDELVASFTHDVEIDFLLPGVPPTGRKVMAPTIAIGRFEDSRLRYEHIYWDQASVLLQIGLLDPNDLPVVGVDAARKLLDDVGAFNGLIPAGA